MGKGREGHSELREQHVDRISRLNYTEYGHLTLPAGRGCMCIHLYMCAQERETETKRKRKSKERKIRCRRPSPHGLGAAGSWDNTRHSAFAQSEWQSQHLGMLTVHQF